MGLSRLGMHLFARERQWQCCSDSGSAACFESRRPWASSECGSLQYLLGTFALTSSHELWAGLGCRASIACRHTLSGIIVIAEVVERLPSRFLEAEAPRNHRCYPRYDGQGEGFLGRPIRRMAVTLTGGIYSTHMCLSITCKNLNMLKTDLNCTAIWSKKGLNEVSPNQCVTNKRMQCVNRNACYRSH